MKTKNKLTSKRKSLPSKHEILQNPKSYFISKHEITLKYTETLRDDIKSQMKAKNIGWTELSKMLKDFGYVYNPNAI